MLGTMLGQIVLAAYYAVVVPNEPFRTRSQVVVGQVDLASPHEPMKDESF
jgi:hypothetical protein